MTQSPLSERSRPESLSQFRGQDHLVGPEKIIHALIKNKRIGSMIFWGPPGTGKTTLSRIIVRELGYPSMEFSATISKINEIRDVMKQAADIQRIRGLPLVVFVDEIHHFNKHSQDAFLPFVERGDIILLGTTIENPAYKINRALLSRMKVLEFFPLSPEVLQHILDRSIDIINEKRSKKIHVPDPVRNILIQYGNGDARRLLNLMDMMINVLEEDQSITESLVMDIIQKKIGSYDRTGDDRYQLISAFHKSVRNSDVDASLFWLYRMLEGGEDPLYIIRRMIRIAVEDIGFGDPESLRMALEIKDAYEYLGSPEGDLFLTQGTVYLASAPKSNSLYVTDKKMKKLIHKYQNSRVPLHIINPSNIIAAGKGAGKNYEYAHDFKEKTTAMRTLPDEVKEKDFFIPNDMGFEKKIRERMSYWEKLKQRILRKKEGQDT